MVPKEFNEGELILCASGHAKQPRPDAPGSPLPYFAFSGGQARYDFAGCCSIDSVDNRGTKKGPQNQEHRLRHGCYALVTLNRIPTGPLWTEAHMLPN